MCLSVMTSKTCSVVRQLYEILTFHWERGFLRVNRLCTWCQSKCNTCNVLDKWHWQGIDEHRTFLLVPKNGTNVRRFANASEMAQVPGKAAVPFSSEDMKCARIDGIIASCWHIHFFDTLHSLRIIVCFHSMCPAFTRIYLLQNI